jgi:phosphohistidine phosphatase
LHLIVTQPPESDELDWNKIKRQAQRIGHHIEQQGDQIVKVVAEIAARPMAVKMVKAAGGTGDMVSLLTRPEKYLDEVLKDNNSEQYEQDNQVTVWCMSNRFFEKFIFEKLSLSEVDSVELEGIQAQCCCLVALKPTPITDLPIKVATVVPSSALPKTFSFETEDGVEQRSRPAYYYKQSGVIPWRIRDGEIEVMLITSSKNRHWGFPKGVIEPGEAPQYSAEIEARDEGGIRGDIGIRLGSFEVPKWGANCTVETFAMRVNEVIPRAVWSERHRNRHWCNLTLARGLVKNQAFIELLDELEKAWRAGTL